MPTVAEVQRQRKGMIREIRRLERATDTELEKLERRLFRLLDHKQLITAAEMRGLMLYYESFVKKAQLMEKAIADSVYTISVEF